MFEDVEVCEGVEMCEGVEVCGGVDDDSADEGFQQ